MNMFVKCTCSFNIWILYFTYLMQPLNKLKQISSHIFLRVHRNKYYNNIILKKAGLLFHVLNNNILVSFFDILTPDMLK